MATPTDNEAENAERPRNGLFKVVRRRGDKKKAARQWLLYGVSSHELARYRSERESGLTNAFLYVWAKKVKGPSHLALVALFVSVWLFFLVCLLFFGTITLLHFLWYLFLFTSARRLIEQYTNWVGAKAAALLAERGDERAMPLLARLWGADGKTPFLTATGERRFERWLAEEYASMPMNVPRDLRGMVRRAFPFRRRFQYADFSDAATDTLLAALRCLAHNPYNENKAVLRHVARFPAPPNAPNRALLREMAMLFLDDAQPVVSLQRPLNAVIISTPSMLPTAIAPPLSLEVAEQTAAPNRRI